MGTLFFTNIQFGLSSIFQLFNRLSREQSWKRLITAIPAVYIMGSNTFLEKS